MAQTANDSFGLALSHLERVQGAWTEPDWADLSFYGLYCLEACVVAAALHLDRARPTSHRAKVDMAEVLHADHGLAAIGDLLVDLNEMRKREAYGDVDAPEGLHAEDTAAAIEEYVDAVRRLLAR